MRCTATIAIATICILGYGCGLKNSNKAAKPAKQVEIYSPITPELFEEVDINKDGVLDPAEAAIASKVVEAQQTVFAPHITAFIAIAAAVIISTVVCMWISGFRGRPKDLDGKDPDDSDDSTIERFLGWGRKGGLTKTSKDPKPSDDHMTGEDEKDKFG